MKSKNSKGQLSLEDRMNAEFKHLRKRIKRLEQIALRQEVDSGSITESVEDIKKG